MVKHNTKYRIFVLALVFWLVHALVISSGCSKKDQPQKTDTLSGKIHLRILYAGLPKTDRAEDFVNFLKRHFQEVEITDYNTFTGSHTTDFDVAIVDHDGADTRAPRLRISRQYARATVTVGVPGAFLCSNLSLKTGYL
jgi:hypothetical protein